MPKGEIMPKKPKDSSNKKATMKNTSTIKKKKGKGASKPVKKKVGGPRRFEQ